MHDVWEATRNRDDLKRYLGAQALPNHRRRLPLLLSHQVGAATSHSLVPPKCSMNSAFVYCPPPSATRNSSEPSAATYRNVRLVRVVHVAGVLDVTPLFLAEEIDEVGTNVPRSVVRHSRLLFVALVRRHFNRTLPVKWITVVHIDHRTAHDGRVVAAFRFALGAAPPPYNDDDRDRDPDRDDNRNRGQSAENGEDDSGGISSRFRRRRLRA